MIYLLSFFWFLRQIRASLFWIYLWQLKEYHIGRFIDHFRTYKGQRIFLNKFFILKIILVLLFLAQIPINSSLSKSCAPWSIFGWFIIMLYLAELLKGFYDFLQKRLKRPVFTKKIIFLVFVVLFLEILYLLSVLQDKASFILYLLIFDILTPLIVSGIVLLFQPLTVLLRNRIIKKAKLKREKFKNLSVIGITGSYGKTSTKEFLAKILEKKYKVLKTKAHQNSEIGISECILKDLKPEHEIFVVEMGAYNRGGIKFLCDIVKPKIGILTGINEQHMALFGSLENVTKTKYELIESLPSDGLAILNASNEIIKNYVLKFKNIRYCSVKEKLDIWAENIKVEKEFVSFKVFFKDGESAFFKINLLGSQNVENILLAIATAKELGMSLKEISSVCKKIYQEKEAMKLIKTKKGLNLIDSTYSANPNGVISHLEYLKIWEGKTLRQIQRKKLIVMPCLIELGQASKKIHGKIGQKIGEVCDLAIITTKERFKEIKEGAIARGMKKENILFMENPKSIIIKIKAFASPDDVILLEGRIAKEVVKALNE